MATEQAMTTRRMQAAARKLIETRWRCEALRGEAAGSIRTFFLEAQLGLFKVQVWVRGPDAPATAVGAQAMILVGGTLNGLIVYRETADDLNGALTGVANTLRKWSGQALAPLCV